MCTKPGFSIAFSSVSRTENALLNNNNNNKKKDCWTIQP